MIRGSELDQVERLTEYQLTKEIIHIMQQKAMIYKEMQSFRKIRG